MNDEGNLQNELEFEEPLDEENEQVPSERKIYTDKGDPEVESLHGKYKRGNGNFLFPLRGEKPLRTLNPSSRPRR